MNLLYELMRELRGNPAFTPVVVVKDGARLPIVRVGYSGSDETLCIFVEGVDDGVAPDTDSRTAGESGGEASGPVLQPVLRGGSGDDSDVGQATGEAPQGADTAPGEARQGNSPIKPPGGYRTAATRVSEGFDGAHDRKKIRYADTSTDH